MSNRNEPDPIPPALADLLRALAELLRAYARRIDPEEPAEPRARRRGR